MIRNYIKIAWRNIVKGKLYTFINVCGLALAFCISIFLFLTAYSQLTYDSFHKDGNRIFQTYFLESNEDGISKSGEMPLPFLPALLENIPDIESAARVQTGRKTTISYKEKYFEELLTYTDPDFFQLFSFPMLQGDKEVALKNILGIVLSASSARTIFGDEDAVGKTVQVGKIGSQINYTVTGIIKDVPENTSIKFDALARIESNPGYTINSVNWHANNNIAFVKLSENITQPDFEEKLVEFSKTYFPDENQSLDEGIKKSLLIKLQALKDIHFDREISGGKGTPILLIYAILGLAIFILLIACFNFINLNIARSFGRAKEVGVRKTLGGSKRQIITQLWLETFLVCGLGFATGFLLAAMLLPYFNARFNANIQLVDFLQPGFLGLILLIFLLVTMFAGGYPALKMANFKLVEILKGKVSTGKKSIFRSAMIVFQFTISTLFICISLISAKQLDFLKQLPTGFDKELVYSIPVGNQVDGRQLLSLFRNELEADDNIISISGSGVNLGKGRDRVTARSVVDIEEENRKISTDWMLVGHDFFKTLNIPIVEGRDFNRSNVADYDNKVIITESMSKILGEKSAVGDFFGKDDVNPGYQILGIVPDFSLYSSSTEHKPITMHISGEEPINYIFLKLNTQNAPQTLDKIKDVWKKLAPGNEFLGSFLDENIEAWYSEENALTSVFEIASGVAIFLSCMGLFAISLLVIELRTKEIGLRLVMGAGAKNILLMISKYFLKLVFIALVIALPLAFFAMKEWLQNYSQRIELGPGIFMLAAISIIIIALLTISYQAIKAALMNPVKNLRTE
jgi:ABC-type antimicrobial peptide transport system permease subunit